MIWIPHTHPLISKAKTLCTGPEWGLELSVDSPWPRYMVYQASSLPYTLRKWVPMVKGQLPFANPTPQSRSIKPGWERPCHSGRWSLSFHAQLCLSPKSRQWGLWKDVQGSSMALSQAFLLKNGLDPLSVVKLPSNREYFNLGFSLPRGLLLMPACVRPWPRYQGGEQTLLPASLFWRIVSQMPWRKDRSDVEHSSWEKTTACLPQCWEQFR